MARSAAFIAVLSGLVFSMIGCGTSDSCISGSSSVVSQTLDLSGLTGVDFQAAGKLSATLGETQTVMVKGPDNLIDRLHTDVINGVWEIGFDECVRDDTALEIVITVPEFDSAELSGSGTIVAETDSSSFDTTLSGAGTVTISGESTRHHVTLAGSGTVESFGLAAAEATVVLSGQGTVNVAADERLAVELSGAGAVFYQGDPELDIRITGAGSVGPAE
jgi:hypothetical protein